MRSTLEILCGLLPQLLQINLQVRGRRIGAEIGVVDTRGEEFVDGEGHTSAVRFPSVIADSPGQAISGRHSNWSVATTISTTVKMPPSSAPMFPSNVAVWM